MTRRARTTVEAPAVAEARLRRSVESIGVGKRRMERSPVLGPQAELTRKRLADSAKTLMQEKGYTNVSVVEIAQSAGVSLATFYQYFREIHDVTALIVVDFIKESLSHDLDKWDPLGGRPALQSFVRRFLEVYVGHVALMELWETGKLVSPDLRALYVDYHRVYRHHLELCVKSGVDMGTIRDDLTPTNLADVMATLVERHCYEHFVLLRHSTEELDAHVQLLTTVLVDVLRLRARRRVSSARPTKHATPVSGG